MVFDRKQKEKVVTLRARMKKGVKKKSSRI